MDNRTDKIKHAIEVFKDEECQCGGSKRYKTFFCYLCFGKLPEDMKKGLYIPIGKGSEDVYEDASAWLRDKEAQG